MKKRYAVLITAAICLIIFSIITIAMLKFLSACSYCKGTGYEVCLWCKGMGTWENANGEVLECHVCDGEKKTACSECDGERGCFSTVLTKQGISLQLQRFFSNRTKPLVGDYVQYGYVDDDELIWRIIDKQDDDFLLLCTRNVAERADTSENDFGTWETSKLRAWLNDEEGGFLSGYPKAYREVLKKMSGDKVSLLTEEQLENNVKRLFGVDIYEGGDYRLRDIDRIDGDIFYHFVNAATGKSYLTSDLNSKSGIRPIIRIPKSKIAVNTSKLNMGTRQRPYLMKIAYNAENSTESLS